MPSNGINRFGFDGFLLDVAERRLTRGEAEVQLPSRAFDLLVVLVRDGGKLVSKEELYQRVWSDAIVEDANLSVQIAVIRKALGRSGYIETVKGHGYRFIPEVTELDEKNKDLVYESSTMSRVIIEHEEVSGSPRRKKTMGVLVALVVLIAAAAMLGSYYFKQPTKIETFSEPVVKISKLTSNGQVGVATLATDGRFVVFSRKDQGGESLWLRQVETGSETRVLPTSAIEFIGLSASPDGNYVFATVFIGNKAEPELWRVPILGGPEEKIQGLVVNSSVAFSPDGGRFAFIETSRKATFIRTASLDGRPLDDIYKVSGDELALPIWQTSGLAWSSSGEVNAAIAQKKDGRYLWGILSVDPISKTASYLIEPSFTDIDHLAWINGNTLGFVGTTTGETERHVWLLAKDTNKLERLTSGPHNYDWLASAGGNLITVEDNSIFDTCVATFPGLNTSGDEIKLGSQRLFSETTPLKGLAWSGNDEMRFISLSSGNGEIWRVTPQEPAGRTRLTSGARAAGGFSVSRKDGSMIYGSSRDGKLSIFLVDPDGQNERKLTDGTEDLWPDFLPDGNSFIYQQGGVSPTVWRRDLHSTESVKLSSEKRIFPVVSPDGSRIAYFFMDHGLDSAWRIGIMDLSSGEVIETFDLPSFVNLRIMRWHPSGEFLSVAFNSEDGFRILAIPASGGKIKKLYGLGQGEPIMFAWSENGEKIGYVTESTIRDVVLLKAK